MAIYRVPTQLPRPRQRRKAVLLDDLTAELAERGIGSHPPQSKRRRPGRLERLEVIDTARLKVVARRGREVLYKGDDGRYWLERFDGKGGRLSLVTKAEAGEWRGREDGD